MKNKFSKRYVGKTIRYTTLGSINAVKPVVMSGLVVGFDGVEPEFVKIFNKKDKKLWDVHVSQLRK